MVADVSSLVWIMKGYKEEDGKEMNNESGGGGGGGGKSAAPITRDLLGGGGSSFDSKELDLDLQVPSGWEKRLDLKSGKVYLQRCNSPNTSSSSNSSSLSDHKHQYYHDLIPKLQDLNSVPLSKTPLNLFDDSSLELKLVSSKTNYQSVCTLDKVKHALERAKREQPIKKRCISKSKSSSPPPLDSSSSSTNETVFHYEDKSCSSSSSFAAGCPSCLLYVLITNNNPKCPRCNTVVPSPIAMKKPRIDLNISI